MAQSKMTIKDENFRQEKTNSLVHVCITSLVNDMTQLKFKLPGVRINTRKKCGSLLSTHNAHTRTCT